ncbi:hypothetical protein LMG19083_04664 [Ralstonia psammae]|uniref:Ankyrin repeat domain-containing protein n=1 Tax=Ralstonia psammae TaxID=3058598 RepID=A0ABM9JZ97_9RALS|nr:ankyrin repeat domain-containing protein [Ralstonia sp. LMG 19083]CAJ0808156.1 hypothetical protein LMG19083_04664 [Ralstonia sp. LMG 19083]
MLEDNQVDQGAARLAPVREMMLFPAAASGDCRKLRELMSTPGVDVNALRWDGATPLATAAEHGRLEAIRVLVGEFSANVDARSFFGESPVYFAAKNGHGDVVQVLAKEFDADVSAPNHYGETPLWAAAKNGHTGVCHVLAALGANVDASDNTGATPLYISARMGHVDVVKLLAGRLRADLNAADESGTTPLYIAACVGNFDEMQALAEQGAHIPLRTTADFQQLDVSFQQELLAWETAQQAVQGGVKIDDAIREGNVYVFRRLVCLDNVNLDEVDAAGRTFLHRAAAVGAEHLVEYLLAEGISPGSRSHDGETPLHEAARYGAVGAMRMLLASQPGRDVIDARNSFGETAWNIANNAIYRQQPNGTIEVMLCDAGASTRPPLRPTKTDAYLTARLSFFAGAAVQIGQRQDTRFPSSTPPTQTMGS